MYTDILDRNCVSVLENGTSTTTLSSTPTLRLMFLVSPFTPSSTPAPSSMILPSSSWSDLLICRESESHVHPIVEYNNLHVFVCCCSPHISAACLPDPNTEFAGSRCYTTGWGKDAFGDFGKYQNILKEVDVPVVSHHQCQSQLQQTRLGYDFKLHPGFVCAGGEEGKDACKVRLNPFQTTL